MRNNKFLWRITLMCTTSLQMAAIGMSPMLSSMAKAFPEASTQTIQLVMVLPSLLVAIIGFVFAFLSNRVPNNILAGLGGLIGVLMGVGACFFHPSVGMLCFWSAVLGVANGLTANGQTTLVNKLFTKKERPGVLGFQTFATNVFAMVMTFVGGILTDIQWNLGYLVYLVAIPGMIGCFLFLPNIIKPHERTLEPEEGEENVPADPGPFSTRLRFRNVLLTVLCAASVNLIWNICTTNMSMFVSEEGLGTATQSGAARTVILLTGAIVGIFFGILYRRFSRRLIAAAFLMMAAGYTVIFFTKAYWVLLLDCVLFGWCISTVMSSLIMRCYETGGKKTALAIAFMMLGANGGTLVSPLMTNVSGALFGTPLVKYRYLLGAILAAVSAIVTAAVLLAERKKAPVEAA